MKLEEEYWQKTKPLMGFHNHIIASSGSLEEKEQFHDLLSKNKPKEFIKKIIHYMYTLMFQKLDIYNDYVGKWLIQKTLKKISDQNPPFVIAEIKWIKKKANKDLWKH